MRKNRGWIYVWALLAMSLAFALACTSSGDDDDDDDRSGIDDDDDDSDDDAADDDIDDDASDDDVADDDDASDDDDGPSDADLVDAINDYRETQALPRIPLSPSLMLVARSHVADLIENDPVGGSCNLHSWSDAGEWSACCYTPDHAQAQCMWDKPSELTDYAGYGYEIAATGTSLGIDDALAVWKSSDGHNNVIVNEDIWKDFEWHALGAAIEGSYAVAWFGVEADE